MLTPGLEYLLDQLLTADGANRRQERLGQSSVVGREEILRRRREVVDVARPADAVSGQTSAHQAGRLEGAQLLEYACSAGSDAIGELIWGCGATCSKCIEDLAPERGRGPGTGRGRYQGRQGADAPHDLGVRAVHELGPDFGVTADAVASLGAVGAVALGVAADGWHRLPQAGGRCWALGP